MEFRGNRSNQPPVRPAAATQPPADRPVAPAPRPMPPVRSHKHKLIMIVVAVLVLVLLLVVGVYAKKLFFGAERSVQRDKYQALFLTNGQVYFGHLSNVDDKYLSMKDIYYLQVQQSVQPDKQDDNKDEQPKVSLTKLGSELHGPEDAMHISRDQVLFWENLKDDGKVVQAIKEYKKQ